MIVFSRWWQASGEVQCGAIGCGAARFGADFRALYATVESKRASWPVGQLAVEKCSQLGYSVGVGK